MMGLIIRGLLVAALTVSSAARAAEVSAAQVTIDNFSFTPSELVIPSGTKVTWLNRDDIPHTIVGAASTQLLKSDPLDTDDSFSFTFSQPGTYRYFCSLHPHMQGTVVVR